jgi:transposase
MRFTLTSVHIFKDWAEMPLVASDVSVAAETGLDERSVRNWFTASVAELERMTPRPTPQIMGLDEIYLLGQPRAVFTDLETHRIVEMLPERKKEYIGRHFAALAGKETISVVVIDMHRPYLDLIQEYLPQAYPVIDKFHVLRQLGEVVERVRKEVRASLSDRARRTLMHDRFLLHKRHKDLTARASPHPRKLARSSGGISGFLPILLIVTLAA